MGRRRRRVKLITVISMTVVRFPQTVIALAVFTSLGK